MLFEILLKKSHARRDNKEMETQQPIDNGVQNKAKEDSTIR